MNALDERVDWLTAPALWPETAGGVLALDRPELLRFAGDDFMDQYAARVGDAGDLAATVAVNETWRAPTSGLAASSGGSAPVKLFQPAHGRFYLVAAGLVCSRYGLPDKAVGGQDSAAFVLRRLVPTGHRAVDLLDPTTFSEHGWFPSGDAGAWIPAPSDGLAAGEERLGLFPTVVDEGGRRRRTLAGLIPVGARERYQGAPVLAAPPASAGGAGGAAGGGATGAARSAVDVMAEADVIVSGLQALRRAAAKVGSSRGLRQGLYFLLLDLDAWINKTPGLRASLAGSLLGVEDSFAEDRTWLEAAAAATASYASLASLGPDDEPPAPVSWMGSGAVQDALERAGITIGSGGATVAPTSTPLHAGLSSAVATTLAGTPSPAVLATTGAGAAPSPVYVVRCAFERPNCRPSHRLVVSRASRPFVMAGFHDPDAPARAVVIPTPVDVSVEGLRKFPKNASIAISKQLRAQTDRVRGITLNDLDTGNIPSAGVSLGLVCSLSIPIITICALILLMIVVQILNIVFFWMPYFQICRPRSE